MVGIDDIRAAADRIAGTIRETPVRPSPSLTRIAGVPVWLKCEQEQHTGAFKLRGAANAIACLPDGIAGVTTASTGNHGRALAHAAAARGLRAVICMSRLVPENKLAAIRDLGAEARITGASQDEAFLEARRLEGEGFALIPPFDHAAVIAGQGTLGLEIMAQIADAAVLAIPLSGGGLLAGVALAAKAINPRVRIVGISMERGAAMAASLDAGQPVEVEELPTLADSLGGGIGVPNRMTFALCRDLIDQVILLDEDEIAAGLRHLWHEDGQIVEGAAAVGAGAILSGKLRADGPIVLILSGRNIDPARHAEIVGKAP